MNFHFAKKNILRVFVLATSLGFYGCTTSPSGRTQLRALPEAKMEQMGDGAFTEIKSKTKTLSHQTPAYKKVRCIVDRLLKVMNETPSAWSVEVFQDTSANAFALPGKNIGVHTGMIKLTENNDQLAAVIGHEIGHVLAHHGNERASQQLLIQGGLTAAQLYWGESEGTNRLLLGALGLGAQLGIILPFSRKHETEADEMGIEYMAEAGFDPRQASRLWVVMGAQSKGAPLEFMSTHPSTSTRANNLAQKAQGLMTTYNSRKNTAPSCSQ